MSYPPPRSPKATRTFVDRGGTFTDVVRFLPDGRVAVEKHRSDQAVVGRLAEGELVFGTTVATNALLEGTGVPCLLIVSQGFRDLVHIGDMTRPSLFDALECWPDPLCLEVWEIPGRMSVEGTELEALPDASLQALRGADYSRFEAVAVALLHSNRNPEHEQKVASCLSGSLHVALGHQLSPAVDYLARIETTVLDAAISPILQGALMADEIPSEALAIRSDGSLTPAAQLRAPDAVLSGPAGGVLAVAEVARMAGFHAAVGLDMGGTSTDVCRVEVGKLPRREGGHRVGGQRIRRPVLEVETIAAGGGSVLCNTGFRLEIGPESAGADPGPACYGRGGPPTLTDAALALGLMDGSAFDPPLVPQPDCIPGSPEDFVAVAREAMAAAIQRIATNRGVDLVDHALVSYGGAAGQHAAAVAERVGMGTVLIHPCAAVLSAWGQSLARVEEQRVQVLWKPLDKVVNRLEGWLNALRATVPDLGEHQSEVGLRYRGTDHTLVVPWVRADRLAEQFRSLHEKQFGFTRPELAIEVVHLRHRSFKIPAAVSAGQEDPFGLGDSVVVGPRRLDSRTTSVWVPENWSARIQDGLLVLRIEQKGTDGQEWRSSARGVALWSTRFMSAAEQGGAVLQRLGRSVNIRERLDFSCAVFDGQGRLVANAPHIPVHLGAMGETVRDLLRREPNPQPGQAWLCNDPLAGGSHLPDLTVVTCVEHDAYRFFVASRAHHVDVGGLTPGSMPPHSTSLSEEGIVFRHVPLLENGGGLRDLAEHLKGCRDPESVRADLEAQIAANAQTAAALKSMGPGQLIDHWMRHLHGVSAKEVRRLLPAIKQSRVTDQLDGERLSLSVEVRGDTLIVDLRGCARAHHGNLNAPPAVVRAAILYGLRCLVGRDFPLNEGALEPVQILLPENSIVNPPAGAAVVGGNVETSQRITDLFLRAMGMQAASQGTMNNLTLGGGDWAYYETIGGGSGASPHGPGVSGVQVHMTNTRATDPEVLENRAPLRIREMALRTGSGGQGAWRGGEGLVREIEVNAPTQVALLATRRLGGAPGHQGGSEGAPGRDSLFRGGEWQTWDGSVAELQPGDRVRIETPGGGGWGIQK
ncbi:MAG: hydantoinase B/oxoprolinase family protein [Myxococcota bacterium]|nr:hydantoinase B/oxoprolinase family protein [Myxococcota bacterium]